MVPGELIPLRKLKPIRALPEGAEHRHLFVDVRNWVGELTELPLRRCELHIAHHWHRPVAVELRCAQPIHAYEQARVLNELGLVATVIVGDEQLGSLLRTLLNQERAAESA